MTIVLVLGSAIGLAVLIFALFPDIFNAKDSVYSLLGIGEKCEETGLKFSDYKPKLDEYKSNKAEINKDLNRIKDLQLTCKDFSVCFPEEYSDYSSLCQELASRN